MIYITDNKHINIPQGDTGLLTVECDSVFPDDSRLVLTVKKELSEDVVLQKTAQPLQKHNFTFSFAESDTINLSCGQYRYNIICYAPGVQDTVMGKTCRNDEMPKFYVLEGIQ